MEYDAKKILERFREARTARSVYEPAWKTAARFLLPEESGRWNGGATPTTGNAKQGMDEHKMRVFDTTAKRALPKYTAILQRVCTPQGQPWHMLGASDPKLMQKTRVREYFDQLNALLFSRRYEPAANFQPVQSALYTSYAVYGNACKFISQRSDKRGLLYTSVPFQSVYWVQNDEGVVDTLFRVLNLTARQAARKFGADKLPTKIKLENDKANPSDETRFEIVHCVSPADDYRADAMDAARHKFMSVYVGVEDQTIIGDRDGFFSFPFTCPRHYTVDNGPYGFSIAQQVEGTMSTLNQMKRTIIRQGQKAVDPVLLAHDDGAIAGRVDLRPGAVNPGGLDSQGRQLLSPLQVGNLAVGEKMIEIEQTAIEDAFFVKMFEMLVEKDMSATEVMARLTDKATLLAPTMGLVQCSDLGPMIEREMELLERMGHIPEMPFELKEAEGEYTVTYTSPMARLGTSEATQGYFQLLQVAVDYAAKTGDTKVLRRFDLMTAIPEMGYGLAVPTRWFASDEAVAQQAEADKQQQDVDNTAKVAPAVAGAAKAAAALPQSTQQALLGGAPGGMPPGAMPPGAPGGMMQ